MSVLLDENLPQDLRAELRGHDVFTVAYMGWQGVENGKLLELAAKRGFDVLITNDRGIEYEQNLASLPLSVLVVLVKSNTIEAIKPLCPRLLDELGRLPPRQFMKLSAS